MPRILTFFAAIFMTILVAQPGWGFPSSTNGESDQMSLIGRWAEGACQSTVAMGDYLIFHHGGFLEIVDYSDPASPVLISQLVTPTYPVLMSLADDVLVVSDAFNTLTIIDLADPAAPVVAGSLAFAGRIEKIAASGEWVYVASSEIMDEGILTPVNLGNPGAPVVHPTVAIETNLDDMAIGSGRLVICEGGEISVYDLGTPASPSFLGQTTVSGSGWWTKALIFNGQAFIARQDFQVDLDILDISGPGAPVPIGQASWPPAMVDSGWRFTGMSIRDMDLFMAGSSGAIYTCDVTDPANPNLLDSFDCGRPLNGMALMATRTFLPLDYGGGFMIVDAADPSNLFTITIHEFGQSLFGVSVDFNRAYVFSHQDMIDILDVTDPESPVKIGRVDTGAEVGGFDARGDYLYVCNNSYVLNVYDVSDPANPFITDQLGSEDQGGFLIERDGLVYVAGPGGLTIFDVDDPDDITEISFHPTGYYPHEFVLQGRYVYSVNNSYTNEFDFLIIDVNNPSNPQTIGSMVIPGKARALAVNGEFAFVATDSTFDSITVSSEIKIFDISDPENPVHHSSISSPAGEIGSWQTGRALVADGGYLYADADEMGVLVYDVSNPAAPLEYGYFDTGHTARGLAFEFNRLFVADWDDGLYILSNDLVEPSGVSPGRSPLILGQNFPNPFNPYTTIAFNIPKRGLVNLRVFDMAGRLVKNLIPAEPHTPGRHKVVWNGRDENGRQVASGTYFYRLEAGSYSETKRMVLIK